MTRPRLRAVAYCRVSSDKQRDAHTIESQHRDLPQLVRRKGWELVARVNHYDDDGRTAKAGHLDKRDGLARLLDDARAGKFDVVVVVNVDRFTRSEDLIERYQIIGTFQRAKVLIASLIGDSVYDLNTEAGQIAVMFGSHTAATENRNRRDRVTAGRIRVALLGHKPGGRNPFGLIWDSRDKTWGIERAAAKVINEVYTRVRDGESCGEIARDFTARRVPGRRGKAIRWYPEYIWTMVRSKTYLGEWQANGEIVVKVPPIVDPALWRAANHALDRRGVRVPMTARTRRIYLLQGLARCEQCGGLIACYSGNADQTGGKVHRPRYLCSNRKRPYREERCKAPTMRVDEIDDRLWGAIVGLFERGDLLSRGETIARQDGGKGDAWERDLKEWRRKLRRLDDVEDTVSTQHRRGSLSARAYAKELDGIKRERDMLQRQIATAEQAIANEVTRADRSKATRTLLKDLRGQISKATDKLTQRAIVSAIVDPGSLTLGPSGLRGPLKLRLPEAGGTVSGCSSYCSQPAGDNGGCTVIELRLMA